MYTIHQSLAQDEENLQEQEQRLSYMERRSQALDEFQRQRAESDLAIKKKVMEENTGLLGAL